jgi:hypothetical protein
MSTMRAVIEHIQRYCVCLGSLSSLSKLSSMSSLLPSPSNGPSRGGSISLSDAPHWPISAACRTSEAVLVAGGAAAAAGCHCWMLSTGCWVLDAGCLMLDARCSVLAARCSMLAAGCCWMLAAGADAADHGYGNTSLLRLSLLPNLLIEWW